MDSLPEHGRINCTKCFSRSSIEFDVSTFESANWRITANPLAWGSRTPEIMILGFSKGPTQSGALATAPHDQIAYKGSRKNVGKILHHIGLLPLKPNEDPANAISGEISNENGRFHFGSLIRCTVERFDNKSETWKGSGGGMLDKFIDTSFGQAIAGNCTTKFLSNLPDKTKLIIMFGLGTKLNYVREAKNLLQSARPGKWRWINDISYSDRIITVVHVEHFASQGALIPNWLGSNNHDRSRYGIQAQEAVMNSGVES
jgi:hypothetical protein